MGYPIRCAVRKCFESVDHDRLLRMLQEHLGRNNLPFISLIDRFLKTDILDRKGRNYACSEVGIPQGSPVSPVLMNVFLHTIDPCFSFMAIHSQPIHYLRR